MSLHSCGALIPSSRLMEYWLGEVTGAEENTLDEHLLGCDECSQRLRELVELGVRVRSLARRGGVQAVISNGLVERLAREGARIREYSVFPNGSVNCTVAPEDDVLVSRLHAPLAGVERLDLVFADTIAPGEQRVVEIPFDAESDSVLVMPSLDEVRKRPAYTARMRLVAVGSQGEKVLGEYVFHHSPWRETPKSG
ncbi:MAG TPA: zf-HC2 domain-containing protein [Steroidobacteraceae bacterium]|nr:zf-HC2 domain-containing protein [Steroidobacteraceae bacterium]